MGRLSLRHAGLTEPRLEAGAIWDIVEGPGNRLTQVRFERCPDGWQATFELMQPGINDLAIVHRLVAVSLREARAAVPQAISYLLGRPVEDVAVPNTNA